MSGSTGSEPEHNPQPLSCSICDQALQLLPDSRPLFFHCEEGHYCTVRDLLRRWLPEDRVCPSADLDIWEDRVFALDDLARQALAQGHIFSAADLQEGAREVTDRIRILRSYAQCWSVLSRNGEPLSLSSIVRGGAR